MEMKCKQLLDRQGIPKPFFKIEVCYVWQPWVSEMVPEGERCWREVKPEQQLQELWAVTGREVAQRE